MPVFYLQQYSNKDICGSILICIFDIQSLLGSQPELNKKINNKENKFAGYINSMNIQSQNNIRKRRYKNGIISIQNRETERYIELLV